MRMSIIIRWTDCDGTVMGCFATTQQEPVDKRGARTGDGDNNSMEF